MKKTTHLTGDWIHKILNIWNFCNIFPCVNPLYITFHSQNWRHSFRLRCTLHINDLHLIFYPLLQLYLCVGFKFRCALKQGRVIAAILVLPVQVVIKAGDLLQTNLRETFNLWTLRPLHCHCHLWLWKQFWWKFRAFFNIKLFSHKLNSLSFRSGRTRFHIQEIAVCDTPSAEIHFE